MIRMATSTTTRPPRPVVRQILRDLKARDGGKIRGLRLFPIAPLAEPAPPLPAKLDPGVGWFAVQTKPRAEFTVADELRKAGFQPFCPSFVRTAVHARRWRDRRLPLFPGYVFVAFNPARTCWGPINEVDGVAGLLEVDEKPLRIPDELMAPVMVDDLLKINDERVAIVGYTAAELRAPRKPGKRTWRTNKQKRKAREARKRAKSLSAWLAKSQNV